MQKLPFLTYFLLLKILIDVFLNFSSVVYFLLVFIHFWVLHNTILAIEIIRYSHFWVFMLGKIWLTGRLNHQFFKQNLSFLALLLLNLPKSLLLLFHSIILKRLWFLYSFLQKFLFLFAANLYFCEVLPHLINFLFLQLFQF